MEIYIPKGFSLPCACGKRHTFGGQLPDGEALYVALPDDTPSPIHLDMGGEWTLAIHHFCDGRVPPMTMAASCELAEKTTPAEEASPTPESGGEACAERSPVETLTTIWCRRCGAFKVDGRVFENEPGTTESLRTFLGIVTDDEKRGGSR